MQWSGGDAAVRGTPLQEEMSESSGPEGSAQGGAAAWGEESTPARERRYATRQATAAKRRTSYNPALDMDKVWKTNCWNLATPEALAGPHPHGVPPRGGAFESSLCR